MGFVNPEFYAFGIIEMSLGLKIEFVIEEILGLIWACSHNETTKFALSNISKTIWV